MVVPTLDRVQDGAAGDGSAFPEAHSNYQI
jgi:hypothetical protein